MVRYIDWTESKFKKKKDSQCSTKASKWFKALTLQESLTPWKQPVLAQDFCTVVYFCTRDEKAIFTTEYWVYMLLNFSYCYLTRIMSFAFLNSF